MNQAKLSDQEKLEAIREKVNHWRYFGSNNAGVRALCGLITDILDDVDTSDRAVADTRGITR